MPDGPPPEPAVQRLRLRYAKRGRLRFASHRDFQRSFERALRRAGVPMAYSAGFTPHPRISYANAAPTGAASEAEYLEIAVTRRCDPDALRVALDTALPPGLDVLDVVEARTGGLPERLEASVWRVELPGVRPQEAAEALRTFLAADRVEVQRLMKTGPRTFDVRAAVLRAEVLDGDPPPTGGVPTVPDAAADAAGDVAGGGGEPGAPEFTLRVAQAAPGVCAILHLVVRHTTPAVRPDDVLVALRSQASLAPPSPARMTRLAQGPLTAAGGAVADPLAADRGVDGA
jgi:radical SAM-linked protein